MMADESINASVASYHMQTRCVPEVDMILHRIIIICLLDSYSDV